jgi:hypothetical protein
MGRRVAVKHPRACHGGVLVANGRPRTATLQGAHPCTLRAGLWDFALGGMWDLNVFGTRLTHCNSMHAGEPLLPPCRAAPLPLFALWAHPFNGTTSDGSRSTLSEKLRAPTPTSLPVLRVWFLRVAVCVCACARADVFALQKLFEEVAPDDDEVHATAWCPASLRPLSPLSP